MTNSYFPSHHRHWFYVFSLQLYAGFGARFSGRPGIQELPYLVEEIRLKIFVTVVTRPLGLSCSCDSGGKFRDTSKHGKVFKSNQLDSWNSLTVARRCGNLASRDVMTES